MIANWPDFQACVASGDHLKALLAQDEFYRTAPSDDCSEGGRSSALRGAFRDLGPNGNSPQLAWTVLGSVKFPGLLGVRVAGPPGFPWRLVVLVHLLPLLEMAPREDLGSPRVETGQLIIRLKLTRPLKSWRSLVTCPT